MKTVSLSGSLRENVGKKDAKKHRKDGQVPCVMYGGKEQLYFSVDEKAFRKFYFTAVVYLVKLNVDGKEHDTVVQDVQYHPVTDRILHIDFLEIVADKPVTIAVPVRSEGTPTGVLKGGKFIIKMRKLKIRSLAKHLPDFVTINTDHLDIGDSIKVSEVKLENVLFLDSPNNIIVGVRTARTVVEEVPGAAAVAGAAVEGAEKKEEAAKK
jgi:large subunit ribosomal protein L25